MSLMRKYIIIVIITSAKEVMLYPAFVCVLFVCLSVSNLE